MFSSKGKEATLFTKPLHRGQTAFRAIFIPKWQTRLIASGEREIRGGWQE